MEAITLFALCLVMLSNACVLGIFVYRMAESRKADAEQRREISEKLDRLTAPKEEEEGKDPEQLFREGFENIMNFQIGGGANGDE